MFEEEKTQTFVDEAKRTPPNQKASFKTQELHAILPT